MLYLQPMTENEFVAYKNWMIEDYARDLASNYRLSLDEAQLISAREMEASLSQGRVTPNHYLYSIVIPTGDGESPIGYLWLEVDSQKKRCFICDIFLHPEFRHQGWGRKVLELLDNAMKQQGITRIGLHVFANNTIAQEFYRKMGYQLTGLNMQKTLVD